MSQSFTDDCFSASHVASTDLQNIENNFAALKSSFSGASAPSNPVAGMVWFDTTTNLMKIRNEANSAWLEFYDFGNDRTLWKTAQMADGVLSADATGRAKMADLFVTNAKINDVDGSKIAAASVSASKLQDNSITPSKMTQGAAPLVTYQFIEYEGDNLSLGYTASYTSFVSAYVFVPAGAKYVIMGVISFTKDWPTYFQISLGGVTGGEVTGYYANSAPGTMNAACCTSGAALDVSSVAGAWRQLLLQYKGHATGSYPCGIHSINVQWYGA